VDIETSCLLLERATLRWWHGTQDAARASGGGAARYKGAEPSTGRNNLARAYNTAVTRLLGRLSPALLSAMTWYSISTPSG